LEEISRPFKAPLSYLAFNSQKLRGHLSQSGHDTFSEFFQVSCQDCVPNLKSVPLALTELLAFNAHNFYGVTLPWPRPPLPSFDIQGLAATKIHYLRSWEPEST